MSQWYDNEYRYTMIHNRDVEEESSSRLSSVLDRFGDQYVVTHPKNKIGFDLTPKKKT